MKTLLNSLILSAFLILSACKTQPYMEVDVATFSTLIKPGAQLVDVRTSVEYSSGALANAKNLDIYSPSFEPRFHRRDNSHRIKQLTLG